MRLQSITRGVMRRVCRPRPAPAILMYHRVANLQHDPWNLAVSPETFDQQLTYLKRHHTPMPLDEIAAALRTRTLPSDAVGITFDDGYRDNLVNAKPLLLRHGLPATLFLATGWVGSNVPFWWDELAELTLYSSGAVDHTSIIDGESFRLRWEQPEAADLDNGWHASGEPRTARQKAYLGIWRKLRRTTQAERARVMTSLRDCFRAEHDSLSMPMSATEVQELLMGNLITLGAHTVHHPALTQLPREECREEILTSARQCSIFTGSDVSSFSYPFGDMNETVRNVVVDAGFSLACSTRAACLTDDVQDLYALPRMAISNGTLEEYAGMLSD